MTTSDYDGQTRISNLSPKERARLIRALKRDAMANQEPSIGKRERNDVTPLSFQQQRLWLLDQTQLNYPAYNEHWAMYFEGVLDRKTLQRTINEIFRRHEVLRTSFAMRDGTPIQVIHPPQDATLVMRDLSGLEQSRRDAEIQKSVDESIEHPFDLAELPLIRMTLFRLGEQRSMLLISAHHIVFDGWSIGLFCYEFTQLYKAFRAGRSSLLPELSLQYADYAVWQRKKLQASTLEPHLRYWTQQLENLPSLLQLPLAKPRPEIANFRGARASMQLGKDLTAKLKSLSRQENVTMFMTLLAIFQTLLFRYSKQTDIAVGSVVANRISPACEQLIGCFVNTLVLRGNLSGNPPFRELLQRISTVAIAAYEHQELPFELLVDALQPERSLSYNPLFQFMFILQNAPSTTVELPELKIATAEVDGRTAKFDLTLSMVETAEGFDATWEYQCELFEPDTIQRMVKHFQTLTAAIVENPDRPIEMYPLMDQPELRQLLVEWNDTTRTYPRERCIHHLIADQVQRAPERVAITDGRLNLTYGELDSQANRLASHLRGLGVGPEVLVGICLPRSPDAVVALLAVLKAGAAFVPLDPAWPQPRLNSVVQDAKAALLITQKGREWSDCAVKVLELDSALATAQSDRFLDDAATPDNLAYAIYTSGSTGHPKGVLVSHRNLVHSTTARRYFYSQSPDAFLLLSPLSSDSSMCGVFWTLADGGTLVVPDEDTALDFPRLFDLLSARQVSHLLTVPSLYAEFLREMQLDPLTLLRTVIVAGESCPARLVDEHQQKLSHVALFNEYGPTEATVWSAVYACTSDSHNRITPIGRPIANTQIYLLDSNLHPVPIGIPAELYIGGAGVARGYHLSVALTAERFIPDPFTKEPGARLYKTGDLGRHLPDGNIELLGRLDQQVKIRGFRLELGEVEAVLLRYPGVRGAAAILRKDGNSPRLVAYVSLREDLSVSEDELREFLRARLSAHAVPSDFVLLNFLPKLPNGKVDRAALHSLHFHSERKSSSAPRLSPLEKSIAGIWQEILQLESIHPHDNFFKIGGDSLSMVRVYNRLRQITEKNVMITDLFKNPTIASLGLFLSKGNSIGGK